MRYIAPSGKRLRNGRGCERVPLMKRARWLFGFFAGAAAFAGVGDPQVRTDHEFYPGELACSNFERLFQTQAEHFKKLTGKAPETEEEKALASWAWRNTHYWHGEEGAQDLWGAGFNKGGDSRTREYWTGLFAHGFGLCGTTHSQWTAEFEYLLGHGRARGVGVTGHNSFEVFLRGGVYGDGRWALLDHDVSTVVFDSAGKRLLSIGELKNDFKKFTDRKLQWPNQQGWPVCGLHPGDGAAFAEYNVAEYLPGYAGPPPMAHLRRGETLRRYLEPGLEDGRTFVFWGRNYNTEGIPGPERSLTWVNQPEKFRHSAEGVRYKAGQARFGNAVYTYTPNFTDGSYREGVVEESDSHVTFEFSTPYIIGATPPNDSEWGIYDAGAKNGMIVRARRDLAVSISLNHGRSWIDAELTKGDVDLTDHVKGRRSYWIRFGSGARALAESGLSMRTVCQANSSVLPRLKSHGSKVAYEASDRAVFSAGPNRDLAQAHLIGGAFNSPTLVFALKTPRGEAIKDVYAAAHVASGNPPDTNIVYQIEYSRDGQSWLPIVKDWRIARMGDEPRDFWSQSMCYGTTNLATSRNSVLVRFRNNGGRNYLRAEAHLVYETKMAEPIAVTFSWTDSTGSHTNTHEVASRRAEWTISTAADAKTRWVEFAAR